MLLLQLKINQYEAGLLFGAILGLVLGLIPLIFGMIKGKKKIGMLGFIGSIVGNAIFGLILSIPVIVISIYLILKKQTSETFAKSGMSSDSEIL